MSGERLSPAEFARLIETVFRPAAHERRVAVMIDLPDAARPDRAAWRERREMGRDWARQIGQLDGYESALVLYRNVGRNNADLPPYAVLHAAGALPADATSMGGGALPFEELFRRFPIWLAPTELSATAPLKLSARRLGFRAATLPGFKPEMSAALRLDIEEIDARCRRLKAELDRACRATISTAVDGERFELELDLRHRTATASGGLIRTPGMAGNLPPGESYIVPYEGEIDGDPSRSRGQLPLQLEGELMVCHIEGNRVVAVDGDGPVAARERAEFAREPAYANVAELGLGILAGYGIDPSGEILLDEKLGLHVAFGRSDHFGGTVGVAAFSSPERVIHIDRVYIPAVQPCVAVRSVVLHGGGMQPLTVYRDGVCVAGF